jgi:predicted MFS family arabinose efflux permease
MLGCLDADGPKAVATVTLIAGFATLVTFPLVIGLASFLDWQQIMQVFAALALVGMVLLPKDFQRNVIGGTQNKNTPPRNVSKVPLDRGPVLIAFSFGLVMMGHAILVFLLPVALSVAGENANASLLALAILGPAQIMGRIAWRYFGSAVSPQNFALLMFTGLCLPALILMLVGTTSIAIYAALILQGACYGVHTILRPSLTQYYVAPAQLGRGLGFVAMVGLLMMAAGPAVGGMVWTVLGLSGLLVVLLTLNGLALVLGLILRNNGPKDVSL